MSTYAENPQARIAALSITAVPATLATAALVLLMHSLIATDTVPPEIEEKRLIDFISTVPEITVIPPIERPPKPEEVVPEPARLEPQKTFAKDDFDGSWRRDNPPPVKVKGPISAGTNMVVPFLKLQPEYPSRALSRGIEGYVDLAFDISSTGATSNIRVVDAEPEGVFERAAIRALERWKYKVPITKGVPQGQVDMMTRLRFELEN
ncbi:MAG: TonB family protein [Pseudomonadota bacterium]